MLGIALHMTILSYQSADAAEQKKLRELEDRHYIRFAIHILKAKFLLIAIWLGSSTGGGQWSAPIVADLGWPSSYGEIDTA